MQFLTTPELFCFFAALGLLLATLTVELAGLLIGFGPVHALDDMFDALDIADSSPLGWLMLGRVPILVLFALFVGGFSSTGLTLQAVAHATTDAYLPQFVAALIAIPAGVLTMHIVGKRLGDYLNTSNAAPTLKSIVGLTAIVEIGTARKGFPAQAKVVSPEGVTHLVMVEPEEDGVEFTAGAPVVLTRQHETQGRLFQAATVAKPTSRQIG